MKILITGGLGYIGSTLAAGFDFWPNKPEIRIVDNFMHEGSIHRALALSSEGIEVIRGDIRDPSIKDHVKWADIVIHLAAIVGAPTCAKNEDVATSTNVDGTYNILDHLGDRLIVYPNTNSGYGQTKGNEECTEDWPLNPISLYGKTKVAAEKAVVKRTKNHIVLRLATVYGASLRPRLDLLVNNFAWKAWKDKYNVIYEGNVMRNYIDIYKVCYGIISMLSRGGTRAIRGVYNFGDTKLNCTKLEMANKIAEVLPHEIIEGQVGSDPDKRNYRVSNKKIEALDIFSFYGKNEQEELWPFNKSIETLVKQFKLMEQPSFGNY